MDYRNLAEEELKLRIAEQFFPTYDCAHRIGKIDFTVAVPTEDHSVDNARRCRKGVACSAPTRPRLCPLVARTGRPPLGPRTGRRQGD